MVKKKTSIKTKKLNVVPTAGYILIEPFEAETKTSSGIYLPETANSEKPLKEKFWQLEKLRLQILGQKGFSCQSWGYCDL